MKDVVTRTDIRYIRRRAEIGQSARQIASDLGINLPRVETFMPRDPEVEKAEHEAKLAQVKQGKRDNPDKMQLNTGKKRRLREQFAEEDAAQAEAEGDAPEEVVDADQ